MRHLLTSLALLATFAAAGQSTMPWNPDANDDSYVGATDMLSTLAVYGQQVGIDSSLTCDYDGTPIEEFWGNVWNGDVIIDSMLVQYHTIDSAQVYLAGCPDPSWETVSFERAWTTGGADYQYQANRVTWFSNFNGFGREFTLRFWQESGIFTFYIRDGEVSGVQIDAILGGAVAFAANYQGDEWVIPFPVDDASMDENGVHFENWGGFLTNATYVNILPYWHYAE